MQRIDWHTSATVLEKLIQYEAVHQIQGWADLRRRLEADRRWEDLLTIARQWTEASPDDAQAWMALGKANLYLGERAVAEAAFKRAIELGITYPAHFWSEVEAEGQ